MLLAAPITAAFKIFFESMDTTRPLAKLLGGNIDDLMASEEYEDIIADLASPSQPPRNVSPNALCASSLQLITLTSAQHAPRQ
jgi:hypothetical protein